MSSAFLLLLVLASAACLQSAVAQEVEASGGCPPRKPFDPKTYDWASAYTAYPVNSFLGTGLFENLIDTFACLAPYALCAYANCTIVEGTNPPVAECGCAVSNVTLAPRAYSVGTGTTILDAALRNVTEQKCGSIGIQNSVCSNPPNRAPFCKVRCYEIDSAERMLMRRDRCGRAGMYGGDFDVISTFNTSTWPQGITSPQGGSGPGPQFCKTGVSTNCFAAACLLKKAWNGMPATCYCPVYNYPGFILSANSTGYECNGQTVDGGLKYIQNGL